MNRMIVAIGQFLVSLAVQNRNQISLMDNSPESNIDLVAFSIVNSAVIADLLHPGEALVNLFGQMSNLAKEITGVNSAAKMDWNDLFAAEAPDADLQSIVERQGLSYGETWAMQWALAHIAKHLANELERGCREQVAFEKILRIEYNVDATVASWELRPDDG
jgi:hypothetical protein